MFFSFLLVFLLLLHLPVCSVVLYCFNAPLQINIIFFFFKSKFQVSTVWEKTPVRIARRNFTFPVSLFNVYWSLDGRTFAVFIAEGTNFKCRWTATRLFLKSRKFIQCFILMSSRWHGKQFFILFFLSLTSPSDEVTLLMFERNNTTTRERSKLEWRRREGKMRK